MFYKINILSSAFKCNSYIFKIGYKNILSLLWENRVFSSWDFFSSRCFCASSKRFTCRSSSRSNGLLSTGLSAFSFDFSFIFFECKLIRDSARLDSWQQWVGREILDLVSMGAFVKKAHNKIQSRTLYLDTFSAISNSLWETCGTLSFSSSPLFFPSRRSYWSRRDAWNAGKQHNIWAWRCLIINPRMS